MYLQSQAGHLQIFCVYHVYLLNKPVCTMCELLKESSECTFLGNSKLSWPNINISHFFHIPLQNVTLINLYLVHYNEFAKTYCIFCYM